MMTSRVHDAMTPARRLAALLLSAMTAALIGCSSGGGGPAPTLSVLPTAFSVEAEQTVAIQATAANVTTPNITYELVPPSALQSAGADEIASKFGTLSSAGQFTGGSEAQPGLVGQVIVRETQSNLEQRVDVQIVPFISEVRLEPTEASVLAGATQTFLATALDLDGQPVPNTLFDFRVEGGIGTITSAGLFTAAQAGTGAVTARAGGAEVARAPVTVVGQITGLLIRPTGDPVTVEAGTTRQFTAVVRDNAGHETEVPATWTASAAIGTISTAGLFTAVGAAGAEGTVTATAQGETATMPVRVVPLIVPPSQTPRNVFGTVSTSAAQPAAGATVRAVRQSDSTVVETTTTDSAGFYQFFLPVGVYRLEATAGAASATRPGVNLPAQDVRLLINLTLAP
jgi:hypothetical protein